MYVIQGFCGDFSPWLVGVSGLKEIAETYKNKLETAALQAQEWIEGDAPAEPNDFDNLFKDIDPEAVKYASDIPDMLEWTIIEVPIIYWKHDQLVLNNK